MNILNRFEYSMNAERNVSTVLNHFNSDYIMYVIDEALNRRVTSYNPVLPNIIDATEQHFMIAKQSGSLDEESIEEFDRTRIMIYEQTIEKLCTVHGLSTNFDFKDNLDLYSIARILYDFLISNFKNYLVSFFSQYIIVNQDDIYKSLGLDKQKKEQVTMFGKGTYNNQVISSISANIEDVLYNMQSFDISLQDILNSVYDTDTSNFINSIISSDSFYKDVFMSLILNPIYGTLIITDIRLMLHNMQSGGM